MNAKQTNCEYPEANSKFYAPWNSTLYSPTRYVIKYTFDVTRNKTTLPNAYLSPFDKQRRGRPKSFDSSKSLFRLSHPLIESTSFPFVTSGWM